MGILFVIIFQPHTFAVGFYFIIVRKCLKKVKWGENMIFNEVMALIMPSFIALLFYLKLIKRKITVIESICYLSLFALITNCVGYAILIYLRKTVSFVYTNIFALKYSTMATCVSIVIVLLYRLLELNLNINLRVEEKDEGEE